MRTTFAVTYLSLAWLAAFGCWLNAPLVHGLEPAVSPQQLEADWLRQLQLRWPRTAKAAPTNVTAEEDAAGGVDGCKDGKWGFHTENERDPWWQVDLSTVQPLDRVVLWNRCDSCGERNTRIIVLLSDDGRQFQQAYQHNGTMFWGQTDNKPLSVALAGKRARFVRLTLAGTSYFHLDEVEVFAVGNPANIAVKKPASQSSVSQWSKRALESPRSASLAAASVAEAGLKLAADLGPRGVNVAAAVRRLQEIAAQAQALPPNSDSQKQRELYLQAQHVVRGLALSNPLLNFDSILFVKRRPTRFPHMSDQYYGWWSQPGGGIYLLRGFRGAQPTVQCVTASWAPGNFLDPDISYDGRKVLFAYFRFYPHLVDVPDKTAKDKLPDDGFYHLYEMNADGSGVRQLTRGRYDDFDGRYLPDGRIVFLSTRKGIALQAGKHSAAATAENPTCADSYVRCGGGNHRPVAVFTLHSMDGDGRDLCAISAFENFEWTPAVASDGRILYARWDYIDRFNGPFMSLWSTNPDGTNPQLVYGNYTVRPQCVFEARPVPNSTRLVFVASAHHSVNGGSLALLDRTRGTEFEPPLTRLTPEVCFPETEGWAESYYESPWPLSEEHFLVSWSDRKLPPHSLLPADSPQNPANALGIYLYDAFGNLTLLHRDPEISATTPLPVVARPREPMLPQMVRWDGPQEGQMLLQDVYRGLDGVERGSVQRLRIVGVPPKVQPHMNSPNLGVSSEDPGKFVLGTVPVETDGSAYFQLPSGVPVFFQALDADGLAIQTMRSLTYVQPGQTLACIGCHEHRDSAPLPTAIPLAMKRGASRLQAGPEGSWPLRFDQLVQPVLEQHCVGCHNPKSPDPAGAKYDLSAAVAYKNLIEYADGDLRKLAFERDRSLVGQMPARNSKLYRLVTAGAGHRDVKLTAADRERLATWMDTYAQRVGHFDAHQEQQLRQFRERLSMLPGR